MAAIGVYRGVTNPILRGVLPVDRNGVDLNSVAPVGRLDDHAPTSISIIWLLTVHTAGPGNSETTAQGEVLQGRHDLSLGVIV